jgi:hypothetical protein
MTEHETSVLAALPFLRGMPPAQLRALAGLCEHVTVAAGRRLFEEGAAADRFWIIDAGQVTLDASVPGRGRVGLLLTQFISRPHPPPRQLRVVNTEAAAGCRGDGAQVAIV